MGLAGVDGADADLDRGLDRVSNLVVVDESGADPEFQDLDIIAERVGLIADVYAFSLSSVGRPYCSSAERAVWNTTPTLVL
ncbi:MULTISPECIES: hypothetical protein [Brevibacterium]|uniref:hypothetical protein n=1 Tax=Brevibacterium TaxID=1696 RepID=UPI00141FC69A|nr:hypothetical protein [Brevibacterium atlanticum]